VSALTWLALAVGLLLAPVPGPAGLRARALAGHEGAGRGGAGLGSAGLGSAGRGGAGRAAERGSLPRPPDRVRAAVAVAAAGACALTAGLRWGTGLGIAAAAALATGLSVARAAVARRRSAATLRGQALAVRQLRAEIEAGARLVDALREVPAPPVAEHALRIGEAAGVPPAEALAGVDRDLQARTELAHAVTGAVAGARASAALLAGLPVLGLLLGAAMGARPVAFLSGSGAGRLVCCVGVLLDAAGVVWTQRLVARAERTW
jgi:tight adherence protein B